MEERIKSGPVGNKFILRYTVLTVIVAYLVAPKEVSFIYFILAMTSAVMTSCLFFETGRKHETLIMSLISLTFWFDYVWPIVVLKQY